MSKTTRTISKQLPIYAKKVSGKDASKNIFLDRSNVARLVRGLCRYLDDGTDSDLDICVFLKGNKIKDVDKRSITLTVRD